MIHHLLEIVLWLFLAFVIGALLGCLLRYLFAGAGGKRSSRTVTGTASAGAVTAGPGATGATMAARGEAVEGEAVRPATETAAAAEKGVAGSEEVEETATVARGLASARVRETESESAPPSEPEGEVAPEKARGAEEAEEKAGKSAAGITQPAGQAEQPAEQAIDDRWKVPPLGLEEPVAGEPDNLEMISGIGPKLAARLHEMGVYYFAQIARWDDDIIAKVDSKLKFPGRIQRDEWVRQARLLAEGRLEQFEREYGSGGLKDKSGKARPGSRTRRSPEGK